MRLTGADIGRFRDDGYIFLPRLFGAAHPRRGGLCAPIQDRPQGPAGKAGLPVAPGRRLMVRLRRHAGAAGDELRGVFGRCDGVQRAARADPGLAPRRRSDRRRHASGGRQVAAAYAASPTPRGRTSARGPAISSVSHTTRWATPSGGRRGRTITPRAKISPRLRRSATIASSAPAMAPPRLRA